MVVRVLPLPPLTLLEVRVLCPPHLHLHPRPTPSYLPLQRLRGVLSTFITSFKDLIGNFSQMTVEYESSAGNLTLSYKVLGTYMINSTQLTETNFTAISTSENSSALLWFNPLGNITMVTYQGVNYTGSAIISASA